MASCLSYVVPIICGLQIMSMLGTQVPADTTVKPTDICTTLITPGLTLNVTQKLVECKRCVNNQTIGCGFLVEADIAKCELYTGPSQFTLNVSLSFTECAKEYPQPSPSEPTTTTVGPDPTTTTTSTTTEKPPTTTGVTPTTTKGSSTTTTTVTPSTSTTTGPTSKTTAGTTKSPVTTTATTATTEKPAPEPSRGFSFANFFGGIVFTLAVSSLGYVAWRFYRARNPNYHTF